MTLRQRIGPLRPLLVTWFLTRTVALVLAVIKRMDTGDVEYYYRQGREHALTTGLIEYPYPVAVALMAPAKVLPHWVYLTLFPLLALVLDAALTYLFWRVFGKRMMWRWVWLIALIGPLAFFRFDIYVTAAIAVYLIAVARRPIVSGLAVVAGFSVKLWPAIFGLGFVGNRWLRIKHMLTAAAGGLAVLAVTALTAGVDRIFTPLTWQATRGFQTESLMSSVLGMRIFVGERYLTDKRNGSFEYVGSGLEDWTWAVQALSKVGYGLVVVLVMLTLWCCIRGHRTPGEPAASSAVVERAGMGTLVVERDVLCVGMTAIIATFILTSPVISPQYLLWLIPPLVLMPIRRVRHLGYVVMALCQLNFPLLFDGLFSPSLIYAGAYRLAVFSRNMALLAIVVLTVGWLLRRVQAQVRARA